MNYVKDIFIKIKNNKLLIILIFESYGSVKFDQFLFTNYSNILYYIRFCINFTVLIKKIINLYFIFIFFIISFILNLIYP